jgi:hypothetical protein
MNLRNCEDDERSVIIGFHELHHDFKCYLLFSLPWKEVEEISRTQDNRA